MFHSSDCLTCMHLRYMYSSHASALTQIRSSSTFLLSTFPLLFLLPPPSQYLTPPLVNALVLTIASLVPVASSYVAAVQRRGPPDWTHHVKQEVGHAPWGWLPTRPKSKQGFILAIFLIFSVRVPVAVKQLLHPAENRCHWASPHELQFLFVLLSLLCIQVVGGKMTETGRLGAFITKVKKGSLADVVGHLRAGANIVCVATNNGVIEKLCLEM